MGHPVLPVTDAPVKHSRAGRDLPAALAVGFALGGALVFTLYVVRIAFIVFVAVAVAAAARELVIALRRRGLRPPMVPVVVGAALTSASGYPFGTYALIGTAVGFIVIAGGWRVLAPPADALSGGLRNDLAASTFALLYLGFLAGFAGLLVGPTDGPRRVTALIVTAVCSDIGGYAAGVLSGGRHKLAPKISPGKSYEGLAGGAVVCLISGVVFLGPVLHSHWYYGLVFGVAMLATATLGDLAESALKRDIGIKDMGNVLPGHGGVMDRLDSLLLSAPVAWLLLSAMAAVH